MARIRYLKPSFFKDEDLASYPHWIRLLYAGLWGLADREGRLKDRPKQLKAEIFPYEDQDVDSGLDVLSQKKSTHRPFIVRYEVEGENYIEILKWNDHQTPHHTERKSEIPKYKEGMKLREITVKDSLNTRSLTGRNWNGDGNWNGEKDLKDREKTAIDSKSKDPRNIDLSKLEVSSNGETLGEGAKHKIHNSLIALFNNRGWDCGLIQSVLDVCASRLKEDNAPKPKGLYPYFDKMVANYINQNSELLAARSKCKR